MMLGRPKYTNESLVPESSSSKVGIAMEKFKRDKSPGMIKFHQKWSRQKIKNYEIHKHQLYLEQGWSATEVGWIYLFIRKGDKTDCIREI